MHFHCSATSDVTQDDVITQNTGRTRHESKEAVHLEEEVFYIGSQDIFFFNKSFGGSDKVTHCLH